MNFHTFRDGESVEYYDPVVSYVQGSTAEERQRSTGRLGKDYKEFKRVNRLNTQNRIPLYEILSTESVKNSNEYSEKTRKIEERLSHLGASYPNIPGLGVYVKGLKVLEGKRQGKKIFDLLFWISQQQEIGSYWKYILLEPIGRLVLNLNIEGKWIQNSTTIFLTLGMNQLANEVGRDILQNNPSAVKDSLERGRYLAKHIFIQFYSNTNPYRPKVRRRGYARSSPVRPGSSKSEILQANTSIEYLTTTGILKLSPEGGYDMEEKKDISEIIFNTFRNSLEAFESYQREALERNKGHSNSETKTEEEDKNSENPIQ